MHGVDVDKDLVAKALDIVQKKGRDGITFWQCDFMDEAALALAEDELRKLGRKKYDLLSCLSVSMWIHLNHGDNGLRTFFRYISRLSRYVLLEPQPWKCYQTAARRMRKLKQPQFEHMSTIACRGDELEPFVLALCSEAGLNVAEKFGKTAWGRNLILLRNDAKMWTESEALSVEKKIKFSDTFFVARSTAVHCVEILLCHQVRGQAVPVSLCLVEAKRNPGECKQHIYIIFELYQCSLFPSNKIAFYGT